MMKKMSINVTASDILNDRPELALMHFIIRGDS